MVTVVSIYTRFCPPKFASVAGITSLQKPLLPKPNQKLTLRSRKTEPNLRESLQLSYVVAKFGTILPSIDVDTLHQSPTSSLFLYTGWSRENGEVNKPLSFMARCMNNPNRKTKQAETERDREGGRRRVGLTAQRPQNAQKARLFLLRRPKWCRLTLTIVSQWLRTSQWSNILICGSYANVQLV